MQLQILLLAAMDCKFLGYGCLVTQFYDKTSGALSLFSYFSAL